VPKEDGDDDDDDDESPPLGSPPPSALVLHDGHSTGSSKFGMELDLDKAMADFDKAMADFDKSPVQEVRFF